MLFPVKNRRSESGSEIYFSLKAEFVCNKTFFLYFYRIGGFIFGRK